MPDLNMHQILLSCPHFVSKGSIVYADEIIRYLCMYLIIVMELFFLFISVLVHYELRAPDNVGFQDTVDSRYLEVEGTRWNTSRYPYFDMSDVQN